MSKVKSQKSKVKSQICILHFALCTLTCCCLAANPAMVRGTAALGVNPAQLAAQPLSRGGEPYPRIMYSLLDIRASLDNNTLSASRYNRYTGAYLDDAAKSDILRTIPESGLRLGSSADVGGLGITIGTFGLSVTGHGAVGARLPKDVFDLALMGNELDRQYSVSTLSGSVLSYADATLSFGVPLNSSLAVGVGLKYLRGLFIAQDTRINGYLKTTPSVLNSELLAAWRWASGGNGYGLDCGVSYSWPLSRGGEPLSRGGEPRLRIAFAACNLNLGINWTNDPGSAVFRIAVESLNYQRIRNHQAATTEYAPACAAPFRTSLPSLFNLGVVYEPVRALCLGLGLSEATANTAYTSTLPQATMTIEYRGLRWLPLSVETAVGGLNGLEFGAGLGLSFRSFELKARVATTGGLFMAARGYQAGLQIAYQSWPAGAFEPDPRILRLRHDPFGSTNW